MADLPRPRPQEEHVQDFQRCDATPPPLCRPAALTWCEASPEMSLRTCLAAACFVSVIARATEQLASTMKRDITPPLCPPTVAAVALMRGSIDPLRY